MTQTISPPPQIGREFVFGTYVTNRYNKENDAVFVKEILHHPDGRIKRNLRMVENYQRPFYITKPDYRDHQDKKEFEFIERLDLHYTNQAKLPKRAYSLITGERYNGYIGLNDVAASPYLYGTDITPVVLLAQEYRQRYPNLYTKSRLAIMDYEWSVTNDKGDILCGAISCQDKLHIAVTKEFLGIHTDYAKDRFLEAFTTHLGKYVRERGIKAEFSIVNRPADVIIALFKSAHNWDIDFLGFWNIKADIGKILQALGDARIDPALVFSDPSVPDEYKYFNWREDTPYKTKADGSRTPKHISELWNVVTAPSKFYCVCLMATFRHIRAREQQRNSYALDSVLHDLLNLGKLKFDYVQEGLSSLDWHIIMQTEHKIEYLVYLAFDCISVELLDEKTGDIATALRGVVGLSEISKLKSNPKRLSDDMYFDLLSQGKILGSTSKDMTDKLDTTTPALKGWIVTLPSELEHNIGVSIINEYPMLKTNITTHAFDIDVRSAYPTSGVCLNTGKSTRVLELCVMEGLTTDEQRAVTINMSNLRGNAISIARKTHKFPSPDDLLAKFKQEKAIA